MFKKLTDFFSDKDISPEDAYVSLMQLMSDEPEIHRTVYKLMSLTKEQRLDFIAKLEKSGMPEKQYNVIRHLVDDEFCKKVAAVKIIRD
jgi:hypothetical protein